MSSITQVNTVSNCTHTNHLFENPLCPTQSLLRKITNIAFHVLTLGLPLAFYHLVLCCRAKIGAAGKNANLQSGAIHSVQQNKLRIGQEALEFAKQKLAEHPQVLPFRFGGHQPINPEIATLCTVYWEVFVKKFEETLKQHKNNPWDNQEVIQAADDCIKMSYAISALTLEDLKAFTENLAAKGDKRTYAKALTEQDSYQYRTFYYCSLAYHWMRGALGWNKHPCSHINEEGLFYPKEPISTAHAQAFYQKGTIQNSWNILYNDYCDRVRSYVKEQDLKSADTRHVNWTQKDTGIKTFRRTPDTLPT